MSDYNPPFTISSKIVSQVATISEALGRISVIEANKELKLRRINKIKTVHGSLAIEGNTLNEEQISAILDGKVVIAPLKEVQEVRNAIEVYDKFSSWNAFKENDLLKAHGILMKALIDDAGIYRKKGAGIMGKETIIHVAPGAEMVPNLMHNLFDWLKTTDTHPLIASCVFHYEFEFIHPFSDGNGRMGRLWQSLILADYNKLFVNVPIESIVHAQQQEYYEALNASTSQGYCTPFIEFMLDCVIEIITTPQVNPYVTPHVKKLLLALDGECSINELLEKFDLKDRKSFREVYLKVAIEQNLVAMTIPEKPRSRYQKYKLTEHGLIIKESLNCL
ncbi:Fic family protein [Lentisphaerota bacterium WC36G]|nr:Fic family protein [Lentisphaerae bacterium WC36]